MLPPSRRSLERRVECRYRFERPLLFSFGQYRPARLEAGHTIELGAGGLLFQSDCVPPAGTAIEIQIVWPFLVQGICAVVLVIRGTVVRADARGAAVRMDYYLFQTAESLASEYPIDSGAACNLFG